MFNFENLRVYEDSLEFVNRVYNITKNWPTDERFGLVDQIRRAATSVTLNIAEGSSRTKKDFCHFLDLTRGSCYECVAVIKIALNREYVNEKEYQTLYDEIEIISRKVSALKRSLR